MGFWEIFWAVNIFFALCSFTILSFSVLIKGWKELKEMLTSLEKSEKKSL